MPSLDDLLNRVNNDRLQRRVTNSRASSNQRQLGVFVRQRVAYTGVIAVSGTLGARNPNTGQYEIESGDGSIRSVQSIGFGAFRQGEVPPSIIIDASGGYVDY